jgi:hypothetical protein
VADTPSSSAPETPKSNLPPERQDEDFQPIAQLVTPNPPEWFREYLHFLYWSVWRISVLEDEQPSRAEMLRTLAEVKNAAEVLMNALGRPVVLEFLGTIRPVYIPKVLYLLVMLRDLHDQARNASQSPILVKMDGRARPGQGRAFAEQTISARTYCALVIVECWKHFNGAYPPPQESQGGGGRRDLLESFDRQKKRIWRDRCTGGLAYPFQKSPIVQCRQETRRNF